MFKTITSSRFALLCYLVLMQNGQGITDKSPTYVTEKKAMLKAGYEAYGYLDRLGQVTILNYMSKWKIFLPVSIHKYESELRKTMLETLRKP